VGVSYPFLTGEGNDIIAAAAGSIPGRHGLAGHAARNGPLKAVGMERGPRWQLGLGRQNGLAFWALLLLEGSFASYILFWPLYIAQLGANPAQVGVVIGAQGLLRLAFLIPSGWLVDRVPAVPLIVAARALGVVGLLIAATLPAWWFLFLPLLFLGAANVCFPAISATIAGAAGERERARAFTLAYTVGPAVATVIAPTIAGKVAEGAGLRAPLLLGAGFALGSIAVFSRLSPPRPPAHDAGPTSYREALAHRPVRALCAIQFLTLLVLTIGTALAPNFLRQVHGLEFDRIGQLGSTAAVGSILLGLAYGRLRPFKQPLLGITVGAACSACFCALLLVAGSAPLFFLAFLLRGGYMVAWSLFAAVIGNAAPPRLQGRAFALGEISCGAGFALAPFLAGPLYEWRPAAPLAVALVGAAPLVLLLWLAAARERRAARLEPETRLAESPV
jgi:MFS family permease